MAMQKYEDVAIVRLEKYKAKSGSKFYSHTYGEVEFQEIRRHPLGWEHIICKDKNGNQIRYNGEGRLIIDGKMQEDFDLVPSKTEKDWSNYTN